MYSPIITGMPMAANMPSLYPVASPSNISAVKIDVIRPTVENQTPVSAYGMPQRAIYEPNNIQQGKMYGHFALPNNMQQGQMYGHFALPNNMQQGQMYGHFALPYNMQQGLIYGQSGPAIKQQTNPQLQQTLQQLQQQMNAVQNQMSNIATTVPFAPMALAQQQGNTVPPPGVAGPAFIQSAPQVASSQPQSVQPQSALMSPSIPSPAESKISPLVPPAPTPTQSALMSPSIPGPAESKISPLVPPVPAPTPIVQQSTLTPPSGPNVIGPQTGQVMPQIAPDPQSDTSKTQPVSVPGVDPATSPSEASQDAQSTIISPGQQATQQVDETSKADETLNVDQIVNLLTSQDADEKTVGIQKIAELGQIKSKESEALLNEKVFKSLHDIVTKDTNPKPNETPEQKEAREKDHVNKMIGMWTLAILQKNFRESMNEEAQKQGIQDLSLNELPEIVPIINNVKNDADPTIRAAAISSLRFLGTRKDHDALSTIFEIALKQDVDPGVKITAIDALMTIAQPQDVQKYAILFNSEMANADSSIKAAKNPNEQQAFVALKETAQKALNVLNENTPQPQQSQSPVVQNLNDKNAMSQASPEQGQQDWSIPAYRPQQAQVAQ